MICAPYNGPGRKLILAFDIGTTFSGISYSILDPGQVPEIKGVTRFPADELGNGSSKIPTVIYYDRHGKVRAVGAEALRESVQDTAVSEGWIKVEWFKLHLRPFPEESMYVGSELPLLPLNKSCIEVFADFLTYLFQCASRFIKDAHANGENVWSSVQKDIHFSQMRKAAVLAGLISDAPDEYARITFVTEGEASLHFAIQNGLSAQDIKARTVMLRRGGDGVIIVDAGGGTIDVSTYGKSTNKEAFEEIAAPECHFHGSIFVTVHARIFLSEYLAESPFIDDLDDIVRCFDSTTKLRFRSDREPEYIKFGSTKENDPDYGIRFGQLKLAGSDICTFFEPSVECIVKAILDQWKSAKGRISHVVLVGGFAASNWLLSEVQRSLKPFRLNIFRPDTRVYVHVINDDNSFSDPTNSNKAVSDGAVSFHLNNIVRSRISKVAYGVRIVPNYDSANPEHFKRSSFMYQQVSGTYHIPNGFSNILPAKTAISDKTEVRRGYRRKSETKLTEIQQAIYCYQGELAQPEWFDVDSDMYKHVCDITVDVSHVKQLPLPRIDGTGGVYYSVGYYVILFFGSTELQAQVALVEDGVEKRYARSLDFISRTSEF
ncbi:hypothetical protein K443DRAFT_134933 [Laccaria amethystina LaAM-08-1]|uniref:Unplaced genomic scaffold K443scaffold_285, whole genome shotgun sequence n=1 Tax=Laccaria amethystina LaAM-08-1 TaxID=1095629 RepID=A0A0C9XCA2_9AGAR|nr:hypothetical protein K443DRAFT_134933 [Laccaria amethystina LaAM-08-1]